MRILVAGAASHTARAFLPELLACEAVSEVTGLDIAPLRLSHPKLRPLCLDIRSPELIRHMEGTDAVVHLAFVVLARILGRRRKDRALMREINLHGSRNVFRAAAAAGVPHVIHASSVAVYGAWPDNANPITEEQPRRPMPGFAYGEDKAALEDWLDRFEQEKIAPRVTRLRLHAIIGPHAQPLVNAIATAPIGIRPPDPELRVQCLHEEDAATALLAALFSSPGLLGAYSIFMSFKRFL